MIVDLSVTYYLSGPMTGIPKYNYPLFEQVATRLRRMGLKVISPHEISDPPPEMRYHSRDCLDAHMLPCQCGTDKAVWQYFMSKCMEQMSKCNGIILLRGWTHSPGARFELARALDEGWDHVYFYRNPPGSLIPMHKE